MQRSEGGPWGAGTQAGTASGRPSVLTPFLPESSDAQVGAQQLWPRGDFLALLPVLSWGTELGPAGINQETGPWPQGWLRPETKPIQGGHEADRADVTARGLGPRRDIRCVGTQPDPRGRGAEVRVPEPLWALDTVPSKGLQTWEPTRRDEGTGAPQEAGCTGRGEQMAADGRQGGGRHLPKQVKLCPACPAG